MTGETLTDHAALESQWDDTAATGVASEVEEAVLGECALASQSSTPRRGGGGDRGRRTGDRMAGRDTGTRALRETARAISRELGAPAWPGPRVT